MCTGGVVICVNVVAVTIASAFVVAHADAAAAAAAAAVRNIVRSTLYTRAHSLHRRARSYVLKVVIHSVV